MGCIRENICYVEERAMMMRLLFKVYLVNWLCYDIANKSLCQSDCRTQIPLLTSRTMIRILSWQASIKPISLRSQV